MKPYFKIIILIVWVFIAYQNSNAFILGKDIDWDSYDPAGPIVSNVSFKLDEGDKRWGKLGFKLSIPEEVKLSENSGIIMRLSDPYIKLTIPLSELNYLNNAMMGFGHFKQEEFQNRELSMELKCRWGVYFIFYLTDEDGVIHKSMLDHTDKYLTPEDYETIYGNLSTEAINSDDCEYQIIGNLLYINTEKNFNLSLFDLVGRCVFSKSFSGNSAIDLSELNCNILIMHIRSNNNNIIKKISIKP